MAVKNSPSVVEKKGVLMYQLKATIPGLKVWRRLLVRGDITLGALHDTLQVAMGWTNSHLHLFVIQGQFYTMPTPECDMGFGAPEIDEKTVKLMDVLPRAKTKFAYQYDFGDSWEHLIAVEKIYTVDAAPEMVAECLNGAFACPPDDCGGVYGYRELLKIIKNPKHIEYESMMEWLGGKFDPNAFDIVRINKCLKKIKVKQLNISGLAKVLMARDGYWI